MRISVGGSEIRVRISNVFGSRPLRIDDVRVALSATGRADGGRQQSPRDVRWAGPGDDPHWGAGVQRSRPVARGLRAARARFNRDVLAQTGVRVVIVWLGTNDIGERADITAGQLILVTCG